MLSHAFFSKDWPQKEVRAMLSMETKERKVILPVWKGVDQATVAQQAPLLVDRYAARAEHGIEEVVAAIEAGADSSQRVRQSGALGQEEARLLQLGRGRKAKADSQRILDSEGGARLIMKAFQSAVGAAVERMERVAAQTQGFSFRIGHRDESHLTATTVRMLAFQLSLLDLYANSARTTFLELKIGRRNVGDFGQVGQPTVLSTKVFRPGVLKQDQVMWTEEDSGEAFDTDGIAGRILHLVTDAIEDDETESGGGIF